mgnify:CR=1 FL=1
MKVLSLFDGMSCGRIALDQLGIPVEKYYASEIDKYAMQVSAANYPDIEQVGDICNLDPKDYQDVDFMLAGSPCQGFSFAGKQLAFDDPRSALFFEFIRLLKAIKPKYFLLENVRMKKEFLEIITQQVSECYEADDVAPEFKDILGNVTINPHFINSSLLSAQSRQRYYWTNIPGIKQPEDRGIVLRDILETETDERPVKDTERNQRHYKNEDEKSLCMTATMYKGAGNNGMTLVPQKPIKLANEKGNHYGGGLYDTKGKSPTLNGIGNGGGGTNNIPKVLTNKPIKVGMNVEEVKVRKHEVDIPGLQTCILDHYAKCGKNKKEIAKELNDKYSTVEHYFRKLGSDFFSIPSEEHWPQLKEILGITTDKFDKQIMEFEYRDGVYESTQRVYSDQGKSPTLTASNKEQMIETKPKQVGVAVDINGHDILKRVYSPDGKSPTVNTCQGGNREPKVVVGGALRARSKDKDGKHVDWKQTKPEQMLELRKDQKSNAVSTVSKDSLVVNSYREVRTDEAKAMRKKVRQQTGKDHTPFRAKKLEPRKDGKVGTVTPSLNKDHEISIKNLPDKSQTIKSQYYKSSRANFERQGTFHATGVQQEDLTWRKLTPLECERLQTVPDDYTNHVSNTRRYAMLGNGWTIEVIKHILQNMEIE